MTKRASFYLIGILFIFILGGWFAYEKYWEYRIKEGAKALGYELNDDEVKYTGLKEYEVTTRLMALMKILRNLLGKTRLLCLQLMDFYL